MICIYIYLYFIHILCTYTCLDIWYLYNITQTIYILSICIHKHRDEHFDCAHVQYPRILLEFLHRRSGGAKLHRYAGCESTKKFRFID